MTKAWFVVRAVVANPEDRPAFDRWYETEHLPDAARAFGAGRAWRCWSRTDPAIHVAFYEFPDEAAAGAVGASDAIKPLVAEFDHHWPRVTRTREILVQAGAEAG